MFVLLVGIFLGYLLINNQINKLGVPDSELEKTEKEAFVELLYPPLFVTQQQLNSQVISLKDLQKQIIALRDEHPQQKERLEFTYSIWNRERKGFVELKSEVDRSIHKAWSYHKRKDKNSVETKFSREAVDWDKAIKSRLSEYQGSQLQVTNTMLDNVIQQRKNLSKLVVGKSSVGLADGALLQSEFSPNTVDKLLEGLAIRSPKQVALLESLNKEINVTVQKRREVRNYALDKPNLQATLQRVMKDWLSLENRATYYRDQALHAVQADYLARILGVNQRDNQIIRLGREINKKLPALLNDLQTSRAKLDKSYQLSSR
jgi:hypothetical protein